MNQSTTQLGIATGADLPYSAPSRRKNRRLRDIRPDLKERIAAKRHEKAQALATAQKADEDIATLERMISEESGRIAGDSVRLSFAAGAAEVNYGTPKLPLDDFIMGQLQSGPKLKEELRESAEAAGYFKATATSPGRVIHATVLHLVRDRRVAIQPDRRIAISRTRDQQTGSLSLVARDSQIS